MLSLIAQSLIREIDGASRVAFHLSESTQDALNDLMDGVYNHSTAATLCPLFDAWLAADAEDGLCLGDLWHGFSQLHKYRENFRADEVGRMFDLLTKVQKQIPTAPLAWVPFRAACEGFADLLALCDAYIARKEAEKQADARMVAALHRLILELYCPISPPGMKSHEKNPGNP